jgi:hypothetical protein
MLANKEIPLNILMKIPKYFEVKESDEEAALYLKPNKDSYSKEEIMEIMEILHKIDPDEFSKEEDGFFRYWYD